MSITIKIHFFPIMCTRGDPKITRIVKKILRRVIQVGNFRPLHSTPTGTGCSDPSATSTAGNIA